jgi:hypothetical protein
MVTGLLIVGFVTLALCWFFGLFFLVGGVKARDDVLHLLLKKGVVKYTLQDTASPETTLVYADGTDATELLLLGKGKKDAKAK